MEKEIINAILDLKGAINKVNENLEDIKGKMDSVAVPSELLDGNGSLQQCMNDLSYALTNCKVT